MSKMALEVAVVGSEALVRTIEDQFPKVAKRHLGPGTHYKSVEAQVVAVVVVPVVGSAVAVAEVVERLGAAGVQSGTGCYIE
jgi:hypothetical protein